MAIVVPNCGELKLLQWSLIDTASPEALTLKLYSNDYTPVAGSVAGSFTEATFTGYVAKSIARASWSGPTTNGDGKAEVSYAQQSWSPTSSETIYGYYVVGASTGVLIWAEKFSSAKSLVSGDTLNVTPKFTLASE